MPEEVQTVTETTEREVPILEEPKIETTQNDSNNLDSPETHQTVNVELPPQTDILTILMPKLESIDQRLKSLEDMEKLELIAEAEDTNTGKTEEIQPLAVEIGGQERGSTTQEEKRETKPKRPMKLRFL